MPCVNGITVEGDAQEYIDSIAVKADANQIPLNAMIELTYRCNIDCVYCYCQYLTNTKDRKELTTDEWKRVLEELAGLGVLHLALTGGEIFVRKDFWEIAQHAKNEHFSLTLFTNGTLIDEKRADLLAALRPASIEMSLLGATEESHDRLTKMPGSWKRMMRATELLRERSLPFLFKTTLMKENIHEQHELARIAKVYGCRNYKNGVEVSPRNDGNREPQKYQIGQRDMFDYFVDDSDGTMSLPPEQPRELSLQKGTCGAGVNGCAVNPFGDFLPCIQLMIPFGNVRERNLRDMWTNPPEDLARIRNTKHYGQIPVCAACDVIDYCNRCHGLAELETGHWDSCYKQARDTAEVVRAAVKYKREGILPNFPNAAKATNATPSELIQIQLGRA
jgi:radical SAM protein with 4Fe4S-binding SPASM domain